MKLGRVLEEKRGMEKCEGRREMRDGEECVRRGRECEKSRKGWLQDHGRMARGKKGREGKRDMKKWRNREEECCVAGCGYGGLKGRPKGG